VRSDARSGSDLVQRSITKNNRQLLLATVEGCLSFTIRTWIAFAQIIGVAKIRHFA
jgi:hypothetical protein